MSGLHAAPDPADVSRNASIPAAPGICRDLCSTCDHAETCGHCGDRERPIFFCELFEATVSPKPAGPARSRPEAAAAPPPAVDLKGLCSNCEERPSCTIPKPQGGIWHCEEYR